MASKYGRLSAVLQLHLQWHKARLKFLDLLIITLIGERDVSFTRLASVLTNQSSLVNLRRIQRFFAQYTINFDSIARLLVAISPVKPPYRLSLDRTHWCFGGVEFNILCLTIVADKVSLPVLWLMLNKAGNSDTQERKELLLNYVRLFGSETIDYLMADREFVGDAWFGFLAKLNIRYCIRLRANFWINYSHKPPVKLFWLFNNLPLNRGRHLEKPVLLANQYIYLSGMKIINDKNKIEFLIVATYYFDPLAFNVYAQRWSIECFFKALKSAGFQIENTHLKDHERLSKLLAIVAIAFTWVYIVGEYNNAITPIEIKTHQRRACSIFRYGLDQFNKALKHDDQIVLKYIQLLTCT
ncbi:IS4 family transposase [Rhodocytophaga aerolata]|uniref:IS4 family transposase n=1 Tax=Rhodocytophaga aerolata TaxID=455078 RepID=A0ABT8RIR7_9BACT|nr:IS4 family transposase [Rhodocytophaga aerolata]MDO1451997.1 IS4 family transposase [Rhodocytophaga aerolata]